MRAIGVLYSVAFAACCTAQTAIPGSPLTVNSTSSAGSSFTYPGVLTGNVTLSLSASGQPCLQNTAYCTNAAGVVVVAGSSGVGQATTLSASFGGVAGTWTFGALLMTISGVGTVPIFAANTANGLSSSAPPTTLSISGTPLSSLGFGNFSVTNPTITFVLADNLYTDNTGNLTVSGSFGTPGVASAPTLSEAGTVSLGILLLAAAVVLLRRPTAVR